MSQAEQEQSWPSPYLSNTRIQYAWAKEKADWLVANAIPNGECLDCHLAPNAKGYSPVSFGRAIKMRAHRLVFLVANPNTDPALMVLHSCDNRRCINLEHLSDGTAQNNTDDMIAKNRKIDDPEVGARRRAATGSLIQSLRDKGYTDGRITAEYGISKSTIWNYTNGPYASTVPIPSGDECDVRVGFDSTGDAENVP